MCISWYGLTRKGKMMILFFISTFSIRVCTCHILGNDDMVLSWTERSAATKMMVMVVANAISTSTMYKENVCYFHLNPKRLLKLEVIVFIGFSYFSVSTASNLTTFLFFSYSNTYCTYAYVHSFIHWPKTTLHFFFSIFRFFSFNLNVFFCKWMPSHIVSTYRHTHNAIYPFIRLHMRCCADVPPYTEEKKYIQRKIKITPTISSEKINF